MDPTTTLITFMLQTSSSPQSVSLLGSWDNFTRHYQMEKDVRRGRDQWRGCWAFKDIICDGDGARSPKRNGGLKMGHSYWYYYELDDGTEVYDTSLPSTTMCPYLPGQPVNILWVPTEVNPLRDRSASMGAINTGFKTMNPDDKFLTPRAPPSIPRLPRLDTSPSDSDRKRSSRSVSPTEGRSPWSARKLFGLRSPTSAAPAEPSKIRAPWDPAPEEEKPRHKESKDQTYSRVTSRSTSRSTSPTSTRKNQAAPRDASPPRHPVVPLHSMNSTSNTFTIPFDITEEDLANLSEEDDDGNFATSSPGPDPEKAGVGALTSLSPPPTAQRRSPLSSLRTAISDMKPLPMLPTDPDVNYSPTSIRSASLVPEPLRRSSNDLSMAAPTQAQLRAPRSHFSIDSVSSGFISPTDSMSSPPDFYDSHDEEDGTTDDSFAVNFNSSPVIESEGHDNWSGYSLPTEHAGSEMTLRMKNLNIGQVNLSGVDTSQGTTPTGARSPRATFGPGMALMGAMGENGEEMQGGSALEHFLAEMGYLGGVISGK